jgi:DNA-binding HxlR family transcriptional regulator
VPGAGDPVASRLQAGGRALLLLADPVSVSILRQLASGPLESTELLDRVDLVSRSTYFERMRDLEELSLLRRQRRGDVPPVAECGLAAPGQSLLPVARHLDAWLAGAPQGPLALGDAYATLRVKALAVAWGSTLLRWLAERPRSLTELEQLVHIFGYRKLERVLRDLVKAGLVERVPAKGRVYPYRLTEWARRAAGLLVAAMRWERQAIPGRSAVVRSIEAEGVMLLGLPLVKLDTKTSAVCALLVDADLPGGDSLGGAVVRLVDGRPISWGAPSELPPGAAELEADCWIRGSTSAWLGIRSEAPNPTLRRGGDVDLAEMLIAALREVGSLRSGLTALGSRSAEVT